MTDINLSAVLGPRYEIVPLGVGVGSGHGSGGLPISVSGTLDVAVTVQEAVGAYRAVGYDGRYSQPNTDSLAAYAGITQMAAIAGASITVVRSGLITESVWTWTPNTPVFIETDGALTQTQLLTGNPIRRIGWAISATEINLDPYPIIGV